MVVVGNLVSCLRVKLEIESVTPDITFALIRFNQLCFPRGRANSMDLDILYFHLIVQHQIFLDKKIKF
jgi:hypothetical protein